MLEPKGETPNSAMVRRSFRYWIGILVLATCLLTPSIWMLATVPPLWRDQDAYNQLTNAPALATYFGHAPLYCVIVRVPLFVGYELERLVGTVTPVSESFFLHPKLTDTGIVILIVLQHLALASAALALILVASKRFWVRLALVAFWASNPLLYTFAHCVGSESLSMICVVGLAAVGLKVVRDAWESNWVTWYAFAVLLWLCLLARHVNVLLVLLVPMSFLISAGLERLRIRSAVGRRNLRNALLALLIGIVCFGVSQNSIREFCRSAKLRYHSRIGFTFLWRLQFLNTLPPAARTALLEKVAARTKSPEAEKLVVMLRRLLEERSEFHVAEVIRNVRSTLFPPGVSVNYDRFDKALNELAWAFFNPPSPEHLRAASADFTEARRTPLSEVTNFLFLTTTYIFKHGDEMPECRGLTTFRNSTAEQLEAIPSQHAFFRLWKGVSYNQCVVAWLVLLILSFLIRKRGNGALVSVCSYGASLTLIGLAMVASGCLIGELLPRYTLPMWQLLLISYVILGAAVGDALNNTRPVRSVNQIPIAREGRVSFANLVLPLRYLARAACAAARRAIGTRKGLQLT